MYINPFVAGVLATIGIELIIILALMFKFAIGIIKIKKEEGDN